MSDQHMYPGGREREERGMCQAGEIEGLLCSYHYSYSQWYRLQKSPAYSDTSGQQKIERCQNYGKKMHGDIFYTCNMAYELF